MKRKGCDRRRRERIEEARKVCDRRGKEMRRENDVTGEEKR